MGYWLFIPLVSHYGVAVHTATLFIFAFVVVPVSSLYLFFASAYHLLQGRSAVFHALVLPSLWVLIEFVKTRLPFLIPWGDIGYAAIPFTPFVQVADLGGVYALTFLIVMINGLLTALLLNIFAAGKERGTIRLSAGNKRRKSMLATGGALIMAVILPVIYGEYRIAEMNADRDGISETDTIEAVIVQGNHSLSDRWSGMGFDNRLKTYLDLSMPQSTDGRRIVVWPETMLNAGRLDDRFFMEMMRWVGSDSLLVSGGLFEDRKTGDTYNSAYFISGQGRLMRYDKQILLPYAEAVPPIDLLGRYYTAPDHFSRGRTPVCIPTPLGAIGTSICLEILYPEFVRMGVKNGGMLLVNLSNDAWFGKSAMPYLHMAAARMRAIENRRFLLRAANSGFSALIGPDGRILTSTGLFTRQRITGRFSTIDHQTLYTRFGEWIVFLAAGIVGICALDRLGKPI